MQGRLETNTKRNKNRSRIGTKKYDCDKTKLKKRSTTKRSGLR